MEKVKQFFWPDGDIDDFVETACKRLLIFFSMFAFLVSVFVTYQFNTMRGGAIPSHAGIPLYSYFLYLLVPVAIYKGMPIRTVTYFVVGYTFFRLGSIAFVMGGLASSQVLFFLPTVLLLTFICGNKAGLVGTAFVLAFYTALALGIQHEINVQNSSIMWNKSLGVFTALIMVYIIGAISSHQMGKSMQGYKQANRQALKANKAKSEFLSNMSHEIRTPLNGVIGITQALRMTKLTEKQKKMVDIMDRSGEALLKVIGDVLDFSKIEAGRVDLELSAFSPRETVQEVANVLLHQANEKNIKLLIENDKYLPQTIYGDGVKYRQIVYNFVSNALKFTHEGEVCIKLSGVLSDQVLHLETRVCDTGIGIAPAEAKEIFDKFTQANSATTRLYGGTGLGLAISRGIVELMGGTIGVDSVPTKGSSFWCILPLPLSPAAQLPIEEKKLRSKVRT